MRKELLAILGCAAAVGLSGCAVTVTKPPVQESRTLTGGARNQVAYFYNVDKSCQSAGVPQVSVTRAPSNGTVTLGAGNHLPQYPAENPLSSCNQTSVASAEVYYESAPNFRGADEFTIEVRFSSSYTQVYSYSLTVN